MVFLRTSGARRPGGDEGSRFHPESWRDIEEIWEYSADQFGLDRADLYLRDIQRAAMTVAEDPHRGLACDEIRSGYRRFSVGSHILFFKASATRVVIVRIPSTDGLRSAYSLTP
jgi:toxin ParE1/3/4